MTEHKPFIGVQLRCANTYCRLYENADKTAFVGHCPKCMQSIRVLPTDLQPNAKMHIYDCGRDRRPISGHW